MNTIGTLYRLTSFGESHGTAIGGVIDGLPAGIRLDIGQIQHFMSRRRPGQSDITTQRRETDRVEFLSGIFEGESTGTPIGFIIHNDDSRSQDYNDLRHLYRPSHADYTYTAKYGIRDHRGGGRASARETAVRCVAGAIALQVLHGMDVTVTAYTSQIGTVALPGDYRQYDLSHIDDNAVRCPHPPTARTMEGVIEAVKAEGDSIGGIVACIIRGVPAGWGEPIFDKLHADLGKAMLGINAAKGFEYGAGFAAAAMRGSQANDSFISQEGRTATLTNHSGGIQGGISNGEDIYFRVAFKPTPTLPRPTQSITDDGQPATYTPHGRHDPCIVPRAVPVVEAMAAIVLLDHYLQHNSRKSVTPNL